MRMKKMKKREKKLKLFVSPLLKKGTARFLVVSIAWEGDSFVVDVVVCFLLILFFILMLFFFVFFFF
jgi:hypothetical protein